MGPVRFLQDPEIHCFGPFRVWWALVNRWMVVPTTSWVYVLNTGTTNNMIALERDKSLNHLSWRNSGPGHRGMRTVISGDRGLRILEERVEDFNFLIGDRVVPVRKKD